MEVKEHVTFSRPSTEHFVHGLFLLGVLFLLMACALIFIKQSPSSQPIQYREAKVSDATLVKNYTARFPVFNQQQADTAIRSYIETKIRIFERKVTNRKDMRNHLAIDFALTHSGDHIVSVVFKDQERVVGQPDTAATNHLTFDIQKGHVLAIQDVLKPTARLPLATLLHDYFKQQAQLALTSTELVNLLEIQPAYLQDFSLEEGALILYLNPRSPASPTGKVGVKIEKSLLADILADDYRTEKPQVVEVVKETAVYHIIERPPAGNIINPAEKMLALTFDDGPSHLTPQLLDTLAMYESSATFFVLGKMVPSHAALLQRMVAEGHEIGNHSWGHPMLSLLSAPEIDYQLDATQGAIQAATGGYTPTLMRPPYGVTSPAVHEALTARGLHEVLWTVDTTDWRDRDTQVIYDRIMAGAADRQIILLHDIHSASVEAATRAIRDLKVQGYQLVTVSQLYHHRQ